MESYNTLFFSLDFMEKVDIENMSISSGLFHGFKFSILPDSVIFYKITNGTLISTEISTESYSQPSYSSQQLQQKLLEIANNNESDCLPTTDGIDEETIKQSFINTFSQLCSQHIWSIVLENFKNNGKNQSIIDKKSIPKQLYYMDPLFFMMSSTPVVQNEEKILNLGINGGYVKKEEEKISPSSCTVLKKIEQNISSLIYEKCKEYEKQNLQTEQEKLCLEENVSRSCDTFFVALNQNLVEKYR